MEVIVIEENAVYSSCVVFQVVFEKRIVGIADQTTLLKNLIGVSLPLTCESISTLINLNNFFSYTSSVSDRNSSQNRMKLQ